MPVTSSDDPYDDEEWYEEEDDADDEEAVPCPECGEPIHDTLDKCPACGYWLSAADRRALRPRESLPNWVKATAVVLLVIFLWGVLKLVY
jgi:hypothetical protein